MKDKQQVELFKASEVKLHYVGKQKPREREKISNPEEASELFFRIWDMDTIEHIEEVKIMLLNRSNHVLGFATISKGGLTGCIMDIRLIMQYVIKSNACAVILAHNHPSGSLIASEADIHITKKIREALNFLDITLLDHLIMNVDKEYVSVMDMI